MSNDRQDFRPKRLDPNAVNTANSTQENPANSGKEFVGSDGLLFSDVNNIVNGVLQLNDESTALRSDVTHLQGRILNERIQNSNPIATHIASQNISPSIGTGRVDFITRVNTVSRTQSYVLAIQLNRNANPHSGNVRVQLNKNFTVPSFSPIAIWGRRRSIVAFYGRSCMTTIFNAPISIADALDTSSFAPMGFVELFPNGELVFTPNNHTGNGNAFANQISTSRFLRTSMILQDLYYEEAP